jgi:uncharacterized protein (DUF983 family)
MHQFAYLETSLQLMPSRSNCPKCGKLMVLRPVVSTAEEGWQCERCDNSQRVRPDLKNRPKSSGTLLIVLFLTASMLIIAAAIWIVLTWSFPIFLTLLIAVSAIGLLLLCISLFRYRKIDLELNDPVQGLPKELEEQWSNSPFNRHVSPDFVVGGTVALNTAEFLMHLSRIDRGVLDAIEEFPSLNNYRDVMEHLHSHEGNSQAWQGVLSNLKGRYGEEAIAENLRASGHHVEMASTTNQEGWDAIVDGEKVQFKSGLEPGGITEALNKNPDIPVITVAEHAEAFSDDKNVTCLEDISGAKIEEITYSTMQSTADLTDFGLELPILTFILSTGRNFNPVMQGKSDDVETALNYTITDTVGVGIGAAAGAKAGAFAGAFAGPVFAVTGGILGGIGGVILGKLIATGIKQKKLREAKAELDKLISDFGKLYITHLQWHKARHLEKTASEISPRFSLLRLFLPTVSSRIRKRMAKGYKSWARQCYRMATVSDYKSFGLRILQKTLTIEEVYIPSVKDILKSIREAYEKVKLEQTKLG